MSFESNDFTVVFGALSGIVRTDAMVYLSLQGVGGGTHLKDEYDLPVGHSVYVPLDPRSTAGKTLAEAERVIKEKFDEIKKNLRDREQKPGRRVTGLQSAKNPAVPGTAGFPLFVAGGTCLQNSVLGRRFSTGILPRELPRA